METVRTYLLSLLSAALLCSILTALTGKKQATGKIIQFLCGLFMAVCALDPLMSLQLERFSLYTADITAQADAAVFTGSQMAEQAMEEIIIEKTEAYILEKAASLGAALEVQVELHDRIPAGVILSGAASPAVRSRLTAWITEDLGIPAEAQKWK